MSVSRNAGFILVSLMCLSSPALAQEHAGHAQSAPAAPIPARVEVPLSPPQWKQLPTTAVHASAHGKTLDCQGVALAAVLKQAGAMPQEPLRGAQLARRVEIVARDGYRVTFSLAELDPTLAHRPVVLVDQCQGKPLDDSEGPLRLIAPEETRPARWIRQIQSITVLAP